MAEATAVESPRDGPGADSGVSLSGPSRAGLPSDSRAGYLRRGRILEYLTLGWNSVEAVVAIGSGVLAGSTALVGFGVDSVIESSSGAILLWRLREGEAGEHRG